MEVAPGTKGEKAPHDVSLAGRLLTQAGRETQQILKHHDIKVNLATRQGLQLCCIFELVPPHRINNNTLRQAEHWHQFPPSLVHGYSGNPLLIVAYQFINFPQILNLLISLPYRNSICYKPSRFHTDHLSYLWKTNLRTHAKANCPYFRNLY